MARLLPRTIFLERLALFLTHLAPFNESVRELRARWLLRPDGYSLQDAATEPGLAWTLHNFWSAWARAGTASATAREQDLVRALGADPFVVASFGAVRDHAVDVDAVWGAAVRLLEPRSSGGGEPRGYPRTLSEFFGRWEGAVPAVRKLEPEERRLFLLDLLYQPEVLVRRLELNYRVIDHLEAPDLSKLGLLRTFTTLYPDLDLAFLSPDPEFDLARPAFPRPSNQADAVAEEARIRFQPGVSVQSLQELAERSARLLAARRGGDDLVTELSVHSTNQRTPLLNELAVLLARILSGEPRARLIEGFADEQGRLGHAMSEAEVVGRLGELRAAGFTYTAPVN